MRSHHMPSSPFLLPSEPLPHTLPRGYLQPPHGAQDRGGVSDVSSRQILLTGGEDSTSEYIQEIWITVLLFKLYPLYVVVMARHNTYM